MWTAPGPGELRDYKDPEGTPELKETQKPSLECGICPLLDGPFGNSAEPPHGTISSPPLSSVKSGEVEVWHLQPKILRFHGHWVYPEKLNPGNSEPWECKFKDNKEPQPCQNETKGLIQLMPELALSGKTEALLHTFCLDFPQLQP